MARAIFTSQTPGFPNESDGAPGLTLGTVFNTSEDVECNGIWWYFPTTAPGSTVLARLYDESDQSLIASATFSASPTTGAWNLATFASPVTLTAGNNYVAAVFTVDRYVATGGLHVGAITNGTFTAPADDGGGVRNGRFNSGGSPAYPSGSFGSNGYLVDVDVSLASTVTGTAVANLGGLTATAAGTPTTYGTAAANLGALTATIAGTRKITATAAANLGGLSGTATGTRRVSGALTASLGGLTATASGSNGQERDLDVLVARAALKWTLGPVEV